jgi:septal ring factor EnvC (AmiA/AmiB activator)
VQNISEPYCKLLGNIAPAVDDDALKKAQQEISHLKKQLQKQSQQMETAMRTMNELSVEYTQIFAGRRTELELQNSSKKMLALFHESLQQVKKYT